MAGVLVLEQSLNGLQFGLMLFLLAAGLTLVFGVMDMINLAHGSLYMVGAFIAAWLVAVTGSFLLGVVGAVALTAGGGALAGLLWLLVQKTRRGALVRAGASNREMATAMGTDIPRLFTIVFGIGAGLCAVAGALLGPLLAVQVGMGENILILAFVVIVIGGIGSIRGALVGAILVGAIDTLGRTLLQHVLREFLPPQWASAAGPAIASIAVYVFMAIVLAIKPQGLFPART